MTPVPLRPRCFVLFFGVAPANALVVTDPFAAPPELLAALEQVFRMPQPRSGWDF